MLKPFRYGDDSGIGDQSSTAMSVGGSAVAVGLRFSLAVFGPVVTLGVGALALGAALKSSYSQSSEQLPASRPYLENASNKVGPVAAKSALGASAKSVYRLTKGEVPRQTFPQEFGTMFANGMLTEVAYDAGSSMMTSKKANESDTKEGAENEFWTKSALGASVASTSRAITRGENPLDTLGEEFAEKVALGGAAKVLEKVIENPSQPAGKYKGK